MSLNSNESGYCVGLKIGWKQSSVLAVEDLFNPGSTKDRLFFNSGRVERLLEDDDRCKLAESVTTQLRCRMNRWRPKAVLCKVPEEFRLGNGRSLSSEARRPLTMSLCLTEVSEETGWLVLEFERMTTVGFFDFRRSGEYSGRGIKSSPHTSLTSLRTKGSFPHLQNGKKR
jgi:hypothetical protein